MGLSVSFDGAQEKAVVTSYQCYGMHVDSTGRYPSRSPTLVVPMGTTLDLRLETAQEPRTLEVRLYPEAGVSASFFNWPEQLPPGTEAVDRLQPTPAASFQYLPQEAPGEYSLVVRAVWEGPIDVFYAISFRLE